MLSKLIKTPFLLIQKWSLLQARPEKHPLRILYPYDIDDLYLDPYFSIVAGADCCNGSTGGLLLFATEASGKKVYLFSKDSNKPLWEYKANTWVTKVDFNGEHIVAGTGPREYFFEGKSLTDEKVNCREIIQPPPRQQKAGMMDQGEYEKPKPSVCGNGICEDWLETYENCPEDCCPPTGCEDDLYEEDAC